jgi:hypothetical protein
MPNRRSPDAALSPNEFGSLRSLATGVGHEIPMAHKEVLLRMRLAQVDNLGRLVLTDAGRLRFWRDNPTAWRAASEE